MSKVRSMLNVLYPQLSKHATIHSTNLINKNYLIQPLIQSSFHPINNLNNLFHHRIQPQRDNQYQIKCPNQFIKTTNNLHQNISKNNISNSTINNNKNTNTISNGSPHSSNLNSINSNNQTNNNNNNNNISDSNKIKQLNKSHLLAAFNDPFLEYLDFYPSTNWDTFEQAFFNPHQLIHNPSTSSSPSKSINVRNINHSTFQPLIDVFETENEFNLQIDLPGMNKEHIKLQITNEQLIIEGERKSEHIIQNNNNNNNNSTASFRKIERSFGKFKRRLTLPDNIDSNNVKASFKDGVLEIKLAKIHTTQPQFINIE
eukprot:TRINITY_DN177_c0_g1_i2.p1 TRINITY_DN177_c0_g1~~TRINITY_DN177_c0_g1_i2.p1  ORF type:complete len:315 (+),score=127.42 TRINITY_DN177_c0_g1_i2:240-1184(+)